MGQDLEHWSVRLELIFELFLKMHGASNLKMALDMLMEELPDAFPGCEPYLYIIDSESYNLMPYLGTQQKNDAAEMVRSEIARETSLKGESIKLSATKAKELFEGTGEGISLPSLIVSCPLQNRTGQTTGVLLLTYPEMSELSTVDERLLSKLLSHLPEIITEHQRLSDAPESIERFNTILDVGTKIAAKIELAPLLGEIGSATTELLSAERSSVYVVDEEEEEIYTKFVQGYDIGEIRLAKGKGIAGRVYESGKTLNVEDAYDLEFFDPSWDKQSGFRTKSMLVCPMFDRQEKIIGVFQVMNKQTEKRFTAEDERVLRTLGSFASVAIENANLYEEQKKQFNSFIEVLAASVDAKDPTTSDHSKYVTGISVVIAKELKQEPAFVEKIRIAATLHDYGKIAVPDAILSKPAKLLPCEKYLMDFHVEKTITILRRIHWSKELRDVPIIAGTHHEALDGSGYPLRLKGDEIPWGGRIIAVADVFHAMIQTRPYKRGFTPQRAIEFCEQMTAAHIDERYGTRKGTHLQADIVAALRQWLERNDWNVELFEEESGWTY